MFSLSRKIIWATHASAMVALFFVFLGVWWLSDAIGERDGSGLNSQFFYGFLALAFGGGYLVYYRVGSRNLPYAEITIDQTGLWSTRKSRENGLVPWCRVARFKDNPWFQCLDVFDANGVNLLKVEYQLEGFDILRELLVKHALQNKAFEAFNASFSRTVASHAGYIAIVLVLLLGGFYFIIFDWEPVLAGVMLVGAGSVLFDYFATPYQINLSDKKLDIYYFLSSHQVWYAEILDIDFADTLFEGGRHTAVQLLTVKDKKPYKFKYLGNGTCELLTTLRSVTGRTSNVAQG